MITLSAIVLDFMGEPENALVEMRRITVPGDTIALSGEIFFTSITSAFLYGTNHQRAGQIQQFKVVGGKISTFLVY